MLIGKVGSGTIPFWPVGEHRWTRKSLIRLCRRGPSERRTRCGRMLACGAARRSVWRYGAGHLKTCSGNCSRHLPKYLPALIWPIYGNCNGALIRFLPVLATRDPSGCLVLHLFLRPFPLVPSASRCGKLVRRSFAVRLSIWKGTDNLARPALALCKTEFVRSTDSKSSRMRRSEKSRGRGINC